MRNLPMRLKIHLIQLLALVIFIALWQVAATVIIPKHLLPGFVSTVTEAWVLLRQSTFWSNADVTLLEFIGAAAIGMPIAMAIGIGMHRHFERLFAPAVQIVMSTPQSIFLPIFLFFFGTSFTQKLLFGLSHLLFVTMLTARAAANSVPETLVNTGRYYGARRFTLYRRIYVPYMLPLLTQAIRLGLVFCLGGVLVAELYVSTKGIGNLVISYSSNSNLRALLAITFLVGAFAVFMNQSLFLLERRLSRWRA